MASLAFDHIAVAATTLAEGVDFVAGKLGVRVPAGGKHPIMNTHNAVMTLGDGVYLEIIAVDPERPEAERPRWFALDDPFMREQLASHGPQLVTWIVRSNDLAATVATSKVPLGEIKQMSRGDLRWQITIRPDGSMAVGGLVPICIEWPPGPHVSTRMADLGVRFGGLVLRSGQPEKLKGYLNAIGAGRLAKVLSAKRGAPAIEAVLVKPDGTRVSLTGIGAVPGGDGCTG